MTNVGLGKLFYFKWHVFYFLWCYMIIEKVMPTV